MDTVAVICCYNDQAILDSMLEQGLAIQEGCEIQRVFLCNKFPSAARSYNYAISQCSADYLVFVHQDVRFLKPDFLANVVRAIKENPGCVYGLCGARLEEGKAVTYSNIYHGLLNKNVGRSIDAPVQVSGLDEVFVAFHRDITKQLAFDEERFDGWHIFLADLCMQARLKNIPIYVLPEPTQHKNTLEMPKYMMIYGLYPKEYYTYLKRICKKYKKTLPDLTVPCFSCKLNDPLLSVRIAYHRFKTACRRKLRKMTM